MIHFLQSLRAKKVWWPSVILAFGLLLGTAFLLRHEIRQLHLPRVEQIQGFLRSLGLWGPVGYILFAAAGTVLCVPATPLIVVAGIFGVWQGTLYALTGLMLGAAIAFRFARITFRPAVERWIGKRPAFQKLDLDVQREGWHVVMVSRLVPAIPFCFQNYMYGLTGISFRTFFIVTIPCIALPVGAYVFLGGALLSGQGDVRQILALILAGCVLLAIVSLLARWIVNRAKSSGK